MLVIANNITTRNPRVNHIFRQLEKLKWDPESAPANELKGLVQQCVAGGADVIEINTQQHYDQPEAMEFAITMAQQITTKQLCLSTNNPESVGVGLHICKHAPFINYISADTEKLQTILPRVARQQAEVILLITNPGEATDTETMLKKASAMLGAANEAGVPNERILIDPGLVHVTKDVGQRHFAAVLPFLQALPDTFDPPVRTTCWANNLSVGAPRQSRTPLETTGLAMLAACGLSSVFLNVLSRENRRMLRLIKIFRNEAVYSDQDAELE